MATSLPAKCQADFCIVPVGTVSPSTSPHLDRVEILLKQSGLEYSMHQSGTRIEGDWLEVMNLIGKAHMLLHDESVQKVHTDVRIETR
ncbi:YkoF-like protein [Rhizodiscina lignyota]|uniref:YkoF-like protein n=1 Tax=Rhizodiscina lignyota TaxID=1504668 RepID=A0A9P4M8T4_9PEZI|nr:YkoF-like protein [Rhizodiscina lignyota]